MADDPDYEVGYGRPPRRHQFPRGKSGNPRGRRSAHDRARAELEKALNRTVTIAIGGAEMNVPVDEAKVWRLVAQALNGSLKSIRAVFNDHWLKYGVLPVSPAQGLNPVIETPAGVSLAEAEQLVKLHGPPPWSDVQVTAVRRSAKASPTGSAT